MNKHEDFQYCVMQDDALNKSDASYLFDLFFLTEDSGNTVFQEILDTFFFSGH